MKRTKLRLLVAALGLASVLLACSSSGPAPEIPPNLDTYEGLVSALALDKDILVYDVRTPQEYATGFIPTAQNIPYSEIAAALPSSHRNRVIVVYCQSGGRARLAYEALVDKGFKYVFDFGSIDNWKGDLSFGSDDGDDTVDCGCP